MGDPEAAACSAHSLSVLMIHPYRDLSISTCGNDGLMKIPRHVRFHSAVQALDALELLPFLDPVLISGQEGIEKPAAAIYLRACEQARVDPVETLHVGDELQA